ncbi:diacylglycerol O-acyltransferase 3-like [Salvia divinorum]|uniref:Diacylglycerol O-acyltransferase 3-like n=1 Tax=Salvia divinorum TaxID=28513 RepID=A0ABD1I4B0_SALDI
MDAAAMALQQPIRFANAAVNSSSTKEVGNSAGNLVRLRRGRTKNRVLSSGFCDRGHLQYYSSGFDSGEGVSGRRISVMNGKEVKSVKEKSVKKMKKKQLKLLKGLSRDLSTFSQMGFGLDSDSSLVDQIKGNMITEATQLLLEQLQKVKAEEKEAKRRIKEEKAKIKAAARSQIGANCEMSSSSSSSESSDSECGEVVDMSSLKRATPTETIIQEAKEEEEETAPSYPTPVIPVIPHLSDADAAPASLLQSPEEPSSSSSVQNISCSVAPSCSKKIEVCMGGKCKKSGAGALLEEFRRAVGMEGAVSGCKCMGKCRDGPNVKVVGQESSSSLCIGVGLEDVNVIMANFIDEHKQIGFAAAS